MIICSVMIMKLEFKTVESTLKTIIVPRDYSKENCLNEHRYEECNMHITYEIQI